MNIDTHTVTLPAKDYLQLIELEKYSGATELTKENKQLYGRIKSIVSEVTGPDKDFQIFIKLKS